MKVAVVAHEKKRLGGDLEDLRAALARRGVADPIWYQVPKSKEAPKKAEKAVAEGADVLLVWGGDGTVRRCLDAVAGTGVPIGILPAGSANLLAANLGIVEDLDAALDTALHGSVRLLDVGVLNGERFAVMAGTGFDAVMVQGADDRKDELGRFAYILSGINAVTTDRVRTTIDVDGERWFQGWTSCVLVGNVGVVTGGLAVFPDAQPDDGELEIGIVTAESAWEWARVLAAVVGHRARHSPLVRTTRGREFDVHLGRELPYEVDGGDRDPVDRMKIHVDPLDVAIRVP